MVIESPCITMCGHCRLCVIAIRQMYGVFVMPISTYDSYIQTQAKFVG